jgi:hypothetical protein
MTDENVKDVSKTQEQFQKTATGCMGGCGLIVGGLILMVVGAAILFFIISLI